MIAISLSSKSSTLIWRYLAPVLSAVMVMSELAVIAFGAEITVQVQPTAPQIVTINRGDSVTWVPFALSENYALESYTGEWKGVLSNAPNSLVTFKFGQPGTYAYRAYPLSLGTTNPVYPVQSGLVTVRDWTNQPPPITINSPPDGFHFSRSFNVASEPIAILASIADHMTNIQQVEFYSGTNLLATVSNAPYKYVIMDAMPGKLALTAKAITTDGPSLQSNPVSVIVEARDVPEFAPPQIIRGNLVLLEFTIDTRRLWLIERSTDFLDWQSVSGATYGNRIYIEPMTTNQTRFFRWFPRS